MERGLVGPVAALTFLWLASSGIDGLLDAFDVIYGTKGELQRPVWRRRLAAMGFTLFACVSLGATAWVARALPYWDWVVWLAGLALGVALVAALFGSERQNATIVGGGFCPVQSQP